MMNSIPKDPYMLYSFVNMALRDKFDSFEEFCNVNDADPDEIIEKLRSVGFEYDAETNQFG